jgi:ParB family transcriptional regulator, chromosome partitioning protein
VKKAATEGLRKLAFPQKARSSLGLTLGLERQQSLAVLAIDKIVPSIDQPRRHTSPKKLEELALSIQERGVLQPIRVREVKTNAEYHIIAGERRWRAASSIGLTEIPAVIVRDQTPEQGYIDALVENVVREDLNPMDRAEALSKIKVHLGALSTWDDIAASGILGISRRQIFHLLGLTTLPEPIKEDIRCNNLTEKHGRALRVLKGEPSLMQRAYDEIRTRKLSGEEALNFVKELKRSSSLPPRKVLKISYRTETELVTALEDKLNSLRNIYATKD